MNTIIENPFPITTAGLAEGKHLYDIFCGICHGKKGGGNGLIYDTDQNPLAKYPAAPANLLSEEFVSATNGRYYHAIMHGKNVMGGYADKISYEERWQVIHYIRSLQAKATKTEYSQTANTLGGGGNPAGANYSSQIALNSGKRMNVGHGDHSGGGHGHGIHSDHGGGHSMNHGGTHGMGDKHMKTMEGGVKSTMQMHDGGMMKDGMKDGMAPGANMDGKKKGKLKKFLKKAGDKMKDGGEKMKDGTKKVGKKLKGALKKKDAGNGGH